jgi:hypothetical protein
MVNITRLLITAIVSGLLLPACDPGKEPKEDYQPHWQSIVSTDPSNGTDIVQMMVPATDRSPSQQNPVALVLSCHNRSTDAYVIWRQYMGVYDLEVNWRVGSEETVAETWSLSTDNEATFAPEPVQLIKRMLGSNQFLIKASPYGSGPVTHLFDTTGLQAEIAPLRKACGW